MGLASKRGEVYLAHFDPSVGAEIKKVRPAVVLQNDIANKYSHVTIVAAISSFKDADLYATEVKIAATEGGLDKDSIVLLNQLRTVDKKRLIKKLGMLEQATMEKIDIALLMSLGLAH